MAEISLAVTKGVLAHATGTHEKERQIAYTSATQDISAKLAERMWDDLVTEFLAGLKTAVELGHSPEALTEEVGPEGTLAERLESLAVHNAYHLGKIVALRQVIHAWPPPD